MSVEAKGSHAEADRLLGLARQGDEEAMNQVWQLMRPEFRSIARALLKNERHRTRFGTTGSGLVAEMWMRLVPNMEKVETATEFLGYGRWAMKNILVDYARERLSKKRFGGIAVDLNSPFVAMMDARLASVGILTKNPLGSVLDAIEQMRVEDSTTATVIELYYIYGHTQEEGAAIMDMSRRAYQLRLAQGIGALKLRLDAL